MQNDQPTPGGLPPYLRIAARYGLILAGISIAMALVGYITETDPAMATTGLGLILLYWLVGIGAMVWAIVMAVRTHRDVDLGGNISLGRAVLVGLATAAVAGAVAGLFTVLYTTVINPGYADAVREAAMARLEEAGLSEEQMDDAMAMAGASSNPLRMLAMSIFGNAFFGMIIGLIVGLVVERKQR